MMVIIPEVLLSNPQVLTIFPPQEPFVPIIRDYIIAHWIGLNLKGTKLIGADYLAALRDVAFSPEKHNIYLVPQFGSITIEEAAEYVIAVQEGDEVVPKAQKLGNSLRAKKLPGIQSRREKVFALPNGIQTIMGAMINAPYLAVDARDVRNGVLQATKSKRPDIPVVVKPALSLPRADNVDPDNLIWQWAQILGTEAEDGPWFTPKEKGKVEVKPIPRHSLEKRTIGMEVVNQDPALHSFSSKVTFVPAPTEQNPDQLERKIIRTPVSVNQEVNAFTLEIGLQPGSESGLPTLVEDVPADTEGDQRGEDIKKLGLDVLDKFLVNTPFTLTSPKDFATAESNALNAALDKTQEVFGNDAAFAAESAFGETQDAERKRLGPTINDPQSMTKKR